MTIYQHSLYYLEFNEKKKAITFRWQDDHADMSFEDFTEACTNYAGFIAEYKVDQVIVDTRNFQYQMPEDFSGWRDNFHYPRLRRMGLQKMAFLMPESAMPYMKNVSAEENQFAVHYFVKETEAFRWLANH
ncbi:MAG: hypothetical protein AAFR66_05775 [Bacteroidota bacterium]